MAKNKRTRLAKSRAKREFARRLRQARLSADYRYMIDLAKDLNIDPETYRSWERGRTEPGIADIQEIANLTGASADFLILGKIPPS